MAAGVVHIPWYATLFRGDKLAAALARDRPDRDCATARRDYRVYRTRDDLYKFMQMVTFEDKLDFEALLVRPRVHRLARATTRAGTRCRCSTPGTT